MILDWIHMPSPLGKLTLVSRNNKLAAILWERERPGRVKLGELRYAPDNSMLYDVEAQLQEYFAGKRNRFDLELDFAGTDFQRAVWNALVAIPFGETRTYTQIAEEIGHPTASRAVGAANGRNPISIIAPCHRVVGADGSLTGFAGGLAAKKWLLTLEGKRFKEPEIMWQQSIFGAGFDEDVIAILSKDRLI